MFWCESESRVCIANSDSIIFFPCVYTRRGIPAWLDRYRRVHTSLIREELFSAGGGDGHSSSPPSPTLNGHCQSNAEMRKRSISFFSNRSSYLTGLSWCGGHQNTLVPNKFSSWCVYTALVKPRFSWENAINTHNPQSLVDLINYNYKKVPNFKCFLSCAGQINMIFCVIALLTVTWKKKTLIRQTR